MTDYTLSTDDTREPDVSFESGIAEPKKKKERFKTPLAPRTPIGDFWSDFIKNKKYLLLCFAVPALIMLCMYLCFQVYPIGESSVLVLDLNGQYVYFFEGLRDIIYGEGSLLYSFSRSLGGEFIGIFAYYLSSPFSLIVALFPKSMITEALLIMFLLKVGSCGLTFGIYVEATRKRNRVATVIFATMYALCGYAVVMQHNTMWIDNLILLPMIMLGIENLIKYGKYRLYIICLSMAIFSNFYIGYMTCIFVVLYYFYYYFACTPEEINPRGERAHFVRSSLRMTLYSLISLAICACLLVCTYYGLKFGKTTFSNPNYALEQKFDWLDMVTKLFIGSYDTVRPEGLPFLYSGTLTLMLLPLYFFAPHIKTREKVASGILMLAFFVSFNISTVDLFWHGMQRPNWLNYRYSFMLCFIMILLSYKAFEKLREIGYRKLIPVSAAWAVLLLFIQKQDYSNVDDFATVWLSLGIFAVYLGVLRAVTWDKAWVRRTGALVLAILVGTEMFGAGLMNMNSLGLDVVYSSRTSYRTFIDGLRPVADTVIEADPSFYRMEKTHHRKTNDNFSLNMNGLSNSTSTLNASTIKLLNSYGISSKSHWSKYLGGTPVSDTIFGVKYIIAQTSSKEEFELYTKTEYGDSDYTVWQNPYAMSLASGVSPSLKDIDTENFPSAFDLMNETVTAMLGEEETVRLFTPADVDSNVTTEKLIRSSIANHTKYAPIEGSSTGRLTFSINITSEDTLYLFIPSLYLRECYLYINGLKNGSYFGNETDRIVELGSYNVGETVTVTLETIEDSVYLLDGYDYFCYLDSQVAKEALPRLSDSSFMIHEYNDDHFEGTIDIAKGDTLVYTSIPYDEGWKIYANGEEINSFEILNGLIGFELSEGSYVLELKYRPDYLIWSFLISLAGGLAFAGAWFITEYQRKRRLLEGWTVYVIPDRGDARNDDIPVLPSLDAFGDGESEISADAENETLDEASSADDEITEEAIEEATEISETEETTEETSEEKE